MQLPIRRSQKLLAGAELLRKAADNIKEYLRVCADEVLTPEAESFKRIIRSLRREVGNKTHRARSMAKRENATRPGET